MFQDGSQVFSYDNQITLQTLRTLVGGIAHVKPLVLCCVTLLHTYSTLTHTLGQDRAELVTYFTTPISDSTDRMP